MKKITRVCGQCKLPIDLEKDDFVTEQGKKIYYHANCLVIHLTSMKRKKWTEESAKEYVDSLRSDSKAQAQSIINKEKLYNWLARKYNYVSISSNIYTRLEAVFSGSFRGLSRGVPAEDLLDIWQRRWDDMVKTYQYNLSKGKVFTEEGRIYYDLAIVLNKVDSYYKWKEQQKTTEQEIKEVQATKKIDFTKMQIEKASENNEEYIIDFEEEE